MALDVWVGAPAHDRGGPFVSFEPEAYYVFLRPLFEVFAEQHGKLIDPYDGCQFEGDELDHLLELVEEARQLIAQQNEVFDIHMGTNVGSFLEPRNEEIYQQVVRSDYLAFVGRLRAAVLAARNGCQPLVFYGD